MYYQRYHCMRAHCLLLAVNLQVNGIKIPNIHNPRHSCKYGSMVLAGYLQNFKHSQPMEPMDARFFISMTLGQSKNGSWSLIGLTGIYCLQTGGQNGHHRGPVGLFSRMQVMVNVGRTSQNLIYILTHPFLMIQDADKVMVNVGGTPHQTLRATLLSLPGTRLAKAAEDRNVSTLFYDRHPGVFSMVMAFYRTGKKEKVKVELRLLVFTTSSRL